MAYTESNIGTYPSAAIDPRDKNFAWVLAYCRAAYSDSRGFMPSSRTYLGNLKMAEIKQYALAQQSVNKYKKMMSPGNPTDASWRAVDWTPPAFMCKYREIAISKILQKKFDFQAYAVDPIARSEEDAKFNAMRVKIMMREAAQKAGSLLAESPLLAPQAGEPEDMEQLMIAKEGYKHEMAIEAEDAINLVFGQNDIESLRKEVVTSGVDYGIGALTQYLDENGMVKLRAVNMEYFGCSYCEMPDLSDMVHWFEIIPTYVGDLAPYYTKEQLDDICKKAINKNGNPTSYIPVTGLYNQAWMRFKVMVMKIKFLSWNDTVYKEERDKRNNTRFIKSSYKNKQFLAVNNTGNLEEKEETDNVTEEYFEKYGQENYEGQQTPKYINSTKKVVYKASWILETEYMHDWGLQENQNRKLSSWWDTDLDIQVFAWNFYKMQFGGLTERLIPLEDRACMAWFNLQNLSNKLIPYIINIDMNAVEGAFPYGKGGAKGKPSDVMDFIFSNFIAPYRSTDLHSRNPNYKPVSIEASGQLTAFGHYYDELAHTLDMMRQISGLNEATDASTVNEKNLNSTNAAMIESTNNALYLISNAEKNILLKTADAVVQKVQIAVQLGKVEGYAKALGSSFVRFFNINPRLSLHELAIFIEEAPTDAQREALWADLSIAANQDLIMPGDKHFIMTCKNLNKAYQILDYRIQKRKEEMHQQQQALVQQQTEGNMQVAQVSEQMKQQTIQMQAEADMQLLIMEKQMEYETEKMKKTIDLEGETRQIAGRIDVGSIAAQAKVISQQISASSQRESKNIEATKHLVGKEIDSKTAIEKQKIANDKPKST